MTSLPRCRPPSIRRVTRATRRFRRLGVPLRRKAETSWREAAAAAAAEASGGYFTVTAATTPRKVTRTWADLRPQGGSAWSAWCGPLRPAKPAR